MKDSYLFSKYGQLNLTNPQSATEYALPINDDQNEPRLLSIGPITKESDPEVAYDHEVEGSVYSNIVVRDASPQAASNLTLNSKEIDLWALPELQLDLEIGTRKDQTWSELKLGQRIRTICNYILKAILLLALLYFFIYSLDILSSAFRLLGGRTAGSVFRDSELLKNPICGLMIGVLATVLVQSSSTSTSIVVSMVASEILDVRTAIPIIMGANIGTSMTNTLVSVAHSSDRAQFRRAFAGATVHDMFNWMTVIILLPVEVAFGFLYHASTAVIQAMNLNKGANTEPPQLLSVLTKPLTDLTIQLDKSKIEDMATGKIDPSTVDSLVKRYCDKNDLLDNSTSNFTLDMIDDENIPQRTLCRHIFANFQISDTIIGVILLIASLAILIGCLICIVKLLSSVLRGRVVNIVHRTVNAELPGRFGFLTGYLAILVGALMTILVQSSSVFTSALTPLVGLGVLSVERMYPLTLGSNVGTTFTSVLAAMASPSRTMASALQISMCHLFFNLSGILLFYPIPQTRRIPIALAKIMGEKTGKYRWFAVLYVVVAFFLLPAAIFGLSTFGNIVFLAVGAPIVIILSIIILINILQQNCPSILPKFLRDWEKLPKWMHSLAPYDRLVTVCLLTCQCGRSDWCCCKTPPTTSQDPKTNLTVSESRRKLVNASTSNVNSRACSRAESPTRFVASRKSLLELIDERGNNLKTVI